MMAYVLAVVFFVASVPHQINYQGWLGRASDTTGVTGTFDMTFTLYDAETGGTALWTETHTNVKVTRGVFNVILGSVNPLPADIFKGGPLWLEIKVGTETLSPRKKLVSVGYAIYSEKAHKADTANYASAVNINYVDSASIADTALVAIKVQPPETLMFSGTPLYLKNTGSGYGILIAEAASGIGIRLARVNGIYIDSVGYYGVYVNRASQDGIWVVKAYDDGVYVSNANDIGFYSGNTGKEGLYIYRTGRDGIRIMKPGSIGVYVDSVKAGYCDGLRVNYSYDDGVQINKADDEGIFIQDAGDDGVYVDNAGNDGIYVGNAGSDGICVWTAGDDGADVYGNDCGIYAWGGNYGGYFDGDVYVNGDLDVTGTLSKGAGSFVIDHPLDPMNKLLRHNFVESPEYLCLYRGKVKLDANGEAVVEMPDYFTALTKEDEATVYLTPIGKPFLVGYEWNSDYTAFKIYGEPNREVSYIVLADRDDPVIHKLRKPVVEDKSKSKLCKPGKLLYPEAYGYPEEYSMGYEKRMERMKKMKMKEKEKEIERRMK